jgi:hypothetical protein
MDYALPGRYSVFYDNSTMKKINTLYNKLMNNKIKEFSELLPPSVSYKGLTLLDLLILIVLFDSTNNTTQITNIVAEIQEIYKNPNEIVYDLRMVHPMIEIQYYNDIYESNPRLTFEHFNPTITSLTTKQKRVYISLDDVVYK